MHVPMQIEIARNVDCDLALHAEDDVIVDGISRKQVPGQSVTLASPIRHQNRAVLLHQHDQALMANSSNSIACAAFSSLYAFCLLYICPDHGNTELDKAMLREFLAAAIWAQGNFELSVQFFRHAGHFRSSTPRLCKGKTEVLLCYLCRRTESFNRLML